MGRKPTTLRVSGSEARARAWNRAVRLRARAAGRAANYSEGAIDGLADAFAEDMGAALAGPLGVTLAAGGAAATGVIAAIESAEEVDNSEFGGNLETMMLTPTRPRNKRKPPTISPEGGSNQAKKQMRSGFRSNWAKQHIMNFKPRGFKRRRVAFRKSKW